MKDKIKVGWDNIKAFLVTNRDEIIESVTSEKQNEKQGKKKKTEIEEKIERERKAIKIPLIMGAVYKDIFLYYFNDIGAMDTKGRWVSYSVVGKSIFGYYNDSGISKRSEE